MVNRMRSIPSSMAAAVVCGYQGKAKIQCSCTIPRARAWDGTLRLGDGKFNGESFSAFPKNLRKVSCQARRRVMVILDNTACSSDLSPVECRRKLTGSKASTTDTFQRLACL